MTGLYRIGKFADLSGVSSKTLRFYDEIGLLSPASIDARTCYRFYRPEQLEELASIRALKDMGVPLSELRGLTRRAGSGQDRRKLLNDLKRRLEQSIQTASQSLHWVNATLDELDNGGRPLSVIVKRRPAVTIASVRSTLESYSEIERLEQELLSNLPAHAISDLRGVLWHRCADSGRLEAEPFVALKKRVPAQSFYDLKQLPAAVLACAYSRPDDQSAENTYDGIRRWMNLRGYRLGGPKRELYVDSLLEIQFPLRSA